MQLQSLQFLASLTDVGRDWILTHGRERSVRVGETITTENQPVDSLLIILTGVFAVRIEGQREVHRIVGPGDLIGDIAFLDSVPATATVEAQEDSMVLDVSHASINQHIQESPSFAADLFRAIARVLCKRLRESRPGVDLNEATSTALPDRYLQDLTERLNAFKQALAFYVTQTQPTSGSDPGVETNPQLRESFYSLLAFMHELGTQIGPEDQLAGLQHAVRCELLPYMHLTETGRRVVVKPRGYAGDFKTIEMIYNCVAGGVPPYGPVLDGLFLQLGPCKAVRNRRGLLTREISRVLGSSDAVTQVTSLACGPAAEIFDIYTDNPAVSLQTTLIDIDFQALAEVASRRDNLRLGKKMRLESANLVYLATGRSLLALQDQDLIYSIGLIDYFEDTFVVALLNWIHAALRPGGIAILGNFHTRNRYRAFMEAILDWKLIHRTEDDMRRLFKASRFKSECERIEFESEGINMFAFGRKSGE